ncbi:hypothetical protein THRCLA_01353, partial [Thraustotheca clavata]
MNRFLFLRRPFLGRKAASSLSPSQRGSFDILKTLADSFQMLPKSLSKWTSAEWLLRLTVLATHNSTSLRYRQSNSIKNHLTEISKELTQENNFLVDLPHYVRVCDASYASTVNGFLKESKFNQEEMEILAQHPGGVFAPKYYLYIDHTRDEIVLVIRGSASIQDFCTDMCMDHEPFQSGYGHRGIVHAAYWLDWNLRDEMVKVAAENPNYKVQVMGHSLGAGTAALVSILWSPLIPRLKCIAFAPPACLTMDLAKSCEGFITSVVCGDDCVPRLNSHNLTKLQKEVEIFDMSSALKNMMADELEEKKTQATVGMKQIREVLQVIEDMKNTASAIPNAKTDTDKSAIIDKLSDQWVQLTKPALPNVQVDLARFLSEHRSKLTQLWTQVEKNVSKAEQLLQIPSEQLQSLNALKEKFTSQDIPIVRQKLDFLSKMPNNDATKELLTKWGNFDVKVMAMDGLIKYLHDPERKKKFIEQLELLLQELARLRRNENASLNPMLEPLSNQVYELLVKTKHTLQQDYLAIPFTQSFSWNTKREQEKEKENEESVLPFIERKIFDILDGFCDELRKETNSLSNLTNEENNQSHEDMSDPTLQTDPLYPPGVIYVLDKKEDKLPVIMSVTEVDDYFSRIQVSNDMLLDHLCTTYEAQILTTPTPITWDEVDVVQTQPIDIPHFLQRSEAEAGFWKHFESAQIQPIQFLGNRLTLKSTQPNGKGVANSTTPLLTPIMSPSDAFIAIPHLMNEQWIYPLAALITNPDQRTAELSMAALSSIIDSGNVRFRIYMYVYFVAERQTMAIRAEVLPKLITHLPPLNTDLGAAQYVVNSQLQRVAFDVLTALCRDNCEISHNVIQLDVVERILDVCTDPTTTLALEERKASALQTLLELLKQGIMSNKFHAIRLHLDELKHQLAGTSAVNMLVQQISHSHPLIAFNSLASLSELFLCKSARDTAIASGVIPILLTCLVSSTLPQSNKTLILQAAYALSILATHVAEAFPLEESVTAVCHVMEILRGALKRSRLASLVCMFITGLSWRQPACIRFQTALRERTSPNLFAILASLLIGGSNDVLCSAAIAVATLSRDAPDSVHAFVKLDLHIILSKLLGSKDTRVATSAAMAIYRFMQPFQLVLAVPGKFKPTPWQIEMIQVILDLGSMNIQYQRVVDDKLTKHLDYEEAIASAYVIQNAIAFFGYTKQKELWVNAATVKKMLQYLHAAANDFLLELLLFFQISTSPLPNSPLVFCDMFVESGGTDILTTMLTVKTSTPVLIASLTIWLHLAQVYYTAPIAILSEQIAVMLLAILEICGHEKNVHVLSVVMHILDVMTESKFCLKHLTLNTILNGDAHRIANLIFVHKEDVQFRVGLVLSRLVRRANGSYIPLPSTMAQLIILLNSPSHDVAYAASHAWGNLLIFSEPLAYFGNDATTTVKAIMHLFTFQISTKYLRDVSRTLVRASKSHEVQGELLGTSLKELEILCRHPIDLVGHHVMLTLTEIGKTEVFRSTAISPSFLVVLDAFLVPQGKDLDIPPQRVLQNQTDALYYMTHVCVNAESQHTVLMAGLVNHVMNLVLSPSLMSEQKLGALGALATLCSADVPTREHILTVPIIEAVLMYLECTESIDIELLAQCLLILLRLLDAPKAQSLIGKSSQMGNIVQTLKIPVDRIRSLACQVIAKLACRNDGVKADMSRMDAINILLNLILLENDRSERLKSHVQRHALKALGSLIETASPASKANKQELFDLPQAMQLTKMLVVSDASNEGEVETAQLVVAVLAKATYHSPRNQRLLQQLEMPMVVLTHVYLDASVHNEHMILLAIESMRVLANLAGHAENRKVMGHDAHLFHALLLCLQSDVHQLHRFSALAMAHLATGNDEHRISMGSYSGLLPALAERLNSKHTHVLENVCFAITKLGVHGGNQIIFGANLVFERLLPLAVHSEVVVQKMAMSVIAVLLEGNDKNKALLVECNAIPILCGLCNLHEQVHSKVLECAMQALSGLVSTQVVEVSKYLDNNVLVHLLGSVNAKLQRTSLQLLASLTKESFNKVRFGEKTCIEAIVSCLSINAAQAERCENDTSLLNSEADLVLVELAATSLANLSFEPLNTAAIIDANETFSCVERLGQLIESALVLSYEASPQKPQRVKGSPKKSHSNNNEEEDHDKIAIPLSVTRPMQSQHILEQCTLVLNNCAHIVLSRHYVTEDLIGIVAMMLAHSSDLVKKCACFILTVWCAKSELHQEWVMNQPAVLNTLIGLLNSSNTSILEAALWTLTKLSNFQDNHIKMANCDIIRILENIIFRFHTSIGSGVLDRAIRLLGNLSLYEPIRVLVKCEGLVAGPLHSILEHQLQPLVPRQAPPILHGKNIARLMSILLGEDALKLFFPKKTLAILKRIYMEESTPIKVRRNIILIFFLLSSLEENRFTIATTAPTSLNEPESLEKDGTVQRLVQALRNDEHELYIRANILAMFSMWSQHDSLCHLLHQCDIAETLLKYMVVNDFEANHFAAVIVHHLSSLKEQVRKRLANEGTTELVLSLLKQCMENSIQCDPFAFSCAGILANLTVHDDTKAIVVNVGGLPTLHDYFQLKIEEAIRVVASGTAIIDILAKVLANLSFDTTCKKVILELNFIPLILEALQRNLASSAGVDNFVLCIGNLSTVNESVGALEIANAIPTLFNLLKPPVSPWIAKCVIWAVSNMTMQSTKSKFQVFEYPNGLNLVLSLLDIEQSKQTDTILECTMTCLSSLSSEEDIAKGLATCSGIKNILRLIGANVRPSLQRKAVKTIHALATFGFADYIDDLSHSHTRLLSIASEGHQSIAPMSISALRRISHLRNESPEVLCSNINGIEALLQLIHSDSTSTVIDALSLLHHIAVVTAPILCNAQYFASRTTCS